jgi:hypothetical protein
MYPFAERLHDDRRYRVPQQIVLSHVCRHWRAVCHETSDLWTNIHINHTNHASIHQEILSRSRNKAITVTVNLPNHQSIDLWPEDRIASFTELFMAVRNHSARIRHLFLRSTNPTLRIIINNVFEDVELSSLEQLHVEQAGAQPVCFFGPLVFNPAVFRKMTLIAAMVRCEAPCLSELESLNLHTSSGTLLDQEQLSHMSYPNVPAGPTMRNLRVLSIDATYPVVTDDRLTPSFNPLTLTQLSICNIQCPDASERIAEAILRLFNIVCMAPGLQTLSLENLDHNTFSTFINVLSRVHQLSAMPAYPQVRNLRLVKVNTRLIARNFMEAFPLLEVLTMTRCLKEPICNALMSDPNLWPRVHGFLSDRVAYGRDMTLLTSD